MGQGKYLSTLALKLLQNQKLSSHFFKKNLKLIHYKIVWKITTLNNDLFKILLLCPILKNSLDYTATLSHCQEVKQFPLKKLLKSLQNNWFCVTTTNKSCLNYTTQ